MYFGTHQVCPSTWGFRFYSAPSQTWRQLDLWGSFHPPSLFYQRFSFEESERWSSLELVGVGQIQWSSSGSQLSALPEVLGSIPLTLISLVNWSISDLHIAMLFASSFCKVTMWKYRQWCLSRKEGWLELWGNFQENIYTHTSSWREPGTCRQRSQNQEAVWAFPWWSPCVCHTFAGVKTASVGHLVYMPLWFWFIGHAARKASALKKTRK